MNKMTSNEKTSIVQLEADELKKLVNEVKETVATDLQSHQVVAEAGTFSAVDLWNIQRRRRTLYSRRNML